MNLEQAVNFRRNHCPKVSFIVYIAHIVMMKARI